MRRTSSARSKSNPGGASPPLRSRDYVPPTVTVDKAARLDGVVTAPPSKSYSHRALMVAGLCGGREILVKNPLHAHDIEATADAWGDLGASIEQVDDGYAVRGIAKPFDNVEQPKKIFVKQSGTTLRFLLPGLAFATGSVRVEGNYTLEARQNRMIVEPLRRLGISVHGKGPDHKIPLVVEGKGYLPDGDITIEGDKSSQVVSALLLWLPLASRPKGLFRFLKKEVVSTVRVQGRLVSRPYVDITREALRRWAQIETDAQEDASGITYTIRGEQTFKPTSDCFSVGGDYSSAAFVLAAACLCEGEVLVKGLQEDAQGDRQIVKILKDMGARIQETSDGIRVNGGAPLRGLDLDCADIPDLVPILCVLGAFASGRTTLTNIAHLRHKESDRLIAPQEELFKLGARITNDERSITIEKSDLKMAEVSARLDHRMAMSLIVAGLAGNGVKVEGAPAIKKSYPRFIEDMKQLGAHITEA